MARKTVGRDGELAAAREFLAAVEHGPAALYLEGDPGIGKTKVWLEGVDLAEDRGFRVLRALPARTEKRLTFSGLTDLLESVDLQRLKNLPEVQRVAVEAALLKRSPTRAPDPRAIFAGVLSVLTELISDTPLIVAIDDVQWLDPPSARALRFSARRLREQRVGYLLAVRHGDPQPLDRLLHEDAGWIKRMHLEPLSPAAMHEVILERLGCSFRGPALRRIHETASGNPLFALEIASILDDAVERPGQPLPVPADVSSLVRLRATRLSRQTRDVLLRAALTAQPTTSLFGRSLGPALRSGLVRQLSEGRIAFLHPLYASALVDDASLDDRRSAHRELARYVNDIEERARHRALSTCEPDEAVASELDCAARQARARGAPDIASELQEWAYELTPVRAGSAGQTRALAAAEDHLRGGAPGRARSLAQSVLEADDRTLHCRALCLLAQVSFHEKSLGDAIGHLHAAAAVAGDDPVLRGAVERDFVFASMFASFDLESARSHADALIANAERSGDDGLLAEALAHATMIDFLLGVRVDEKRLTRALELEDTERRVPAQFTPTYLAGSLALYRGRYEHGRLLLYSLLTRLRERGAESELPLVSCTLAWLECVGGELQTARRHADEAYETALLTESTTGGAMALVARALVDAHAGLAESCREALDSAFRAAEDTGLGLARLQGISILGFLELSLGNPAAACANFETWWTELHQGERATPSADEIEALVAVGELERAERLTQLLDEWASEVDAWLTLAAIRRCRALLLAANGDPERALSEISRALDGHERFHAPLELGRTLLAKGVIERRLKKKAAAKTSIECALAAFEGVGASLWIEKARGELARVGLRRAASNGLTEGERRIAELAASGLTNRQVAARLYVSPKTVEASLTRAYRKLRIHSRAELGAVIAGRNEAARSSESLVWPGDQPARL